ncbi:MAG: RHS repeat-associated core domain-containing protein [Acidimicrobiales bacterium]
MVGPGSASLARFRRRRSRRHRPAAVVLILFALIASGFDGAAAQASLPKRAAPELRLDPLSLSRWAGAWDRFMDALTGGNTTNALAPGEREARDEGEVIDGPGFVPPARVIGSKVSTRDRHEPKPLPLRELVELRTSSSETWLNDDGTRSVRMFDQDKYFAAADGSMAPIDDRLVADDAGGFVNAAGPWHVRFAPLDPAVRTGVSVARAGQQDVVFFPSFASKAVAPQLSKDALSVTYPDVIPGVDLSYSVAGARVKERIVLRSRPSVASFDFVVEGLALRESASQSGLLEREDATTDQVKVLAPFVTDLAGAPIHNAADAKATQRSSAKPDVVRGAKSVKASEITVGVDAAWLASVPDSAFPLVLDPTISDAGGDRKVFNNSGWSPGLNAFTESFGGRNTGENWRSFLVFSNYSVAAGGTVTEAHIDVSAVTSWNLNQYSPIHVHKATTSNPASWSYTTVDPTVWGSTSFDYSGTIDVTGLVSGWVSASQWNQAVAFTGDESTDPSKKAFNATLVVTYTTNGAPPPAVVNPLPIHNSVLVTDTPAMSVNTVTDPNGDTVTYKFEFSTDPAFGGSPSPTSGWLASPSFTPTSGSLSANTDYYWRVLTKDTGGLITTPTSGFKLRRAPAQLGYDGLGGYLGGVNSLVGNMAFTETDVKVNSTGPALSLPRTYNTFDSKPGPFGSGWSSPFFMRWEQVSGNPNMDLQYPDGRRERQTPTSGTGGTIIADSFTGTNGSGWNATNWTTSSHGSGATVDIQSNAGRMSINAGLGRGRALGTAATDNTDAEVLTKVKFDNTSGGVFGLTWLRGSTTWNSTDGEILTNGYFVWVQASGAFSISKIVSNVETGLASGTFTPAANAFFNLRFRAQGNMLQAKIWQDGTTEPSGWTLSTTDSSITTSGRAALSSMGGIASTVTFDEYSLTNLSGSGAGWAPPPGYIGALTGTASTVKTLTTGDGTLYTFAAPATNPGNYATSITDPFGRVLNIDYSTIATDGKIKLTDIASGRQIRLNTTGGTTNFRITSAEINNPAGGVFTWTYTYDTTSYPGEVRLTKMCDPRGPTYCHNYTWQAQANGKIYKDVDAKGQTNFELTYGTTGRITTVKNGLGDLSKFQYSQQTSAPFEITSKYLDERYADIQTNWDNKASQQIYSADGEMIKEYSPGVATPTTYTYDPSTTMRSSVTDANGHTSSFVYDTKLRVIKTTNAAGESNFYGYDDAGNRTKVCDGRTADATGDGLPDADTYCTISDYGTTAPQRLLRMIQSRHAPGLPSETWAYTTGAEVGYGGAGTQPAGLLKTYIDVLGETTTYEYFSNGDLARVSDTGGDDRRIVYDSLGRLITSTQVSTAYPSGVSTTFTYDAINNVLTETGPAVTNIVSGLVHRQKITTTYDANSNKTQIDATDIGGSVAPDALRRTTNTYDAIDRLYQTTDVLSGVMQRRYDAAGNVILTQDAAGRWLRTTFNDRVLPTKIESLGVYAGSTTTTALLAASGTTLSQTEYDNASRVTATLDALAHRTETTYDNADRVSKVVTKNYQLDPGVSPTRDILVSLTTYDAAGDALTLKEGGPADASAPLRTTTRTYDNAGRLTSTTLAGVGRTTTVTLNAAGQPLTSTTTQSGVQTGGVGTAEVRYSYDSAGRPLTETVENGATDLVTSYTYDSRGFRATMVPPRGNEAGANPNAFKIQYLNDEVGRPYGTISPTVAAESGGGAPSNVNPQVDVGYNTFGDNTHQKDERGNITTIAFDTLGRRSVITYPTYTPAGGSPITPTESYAYDAVGNLTGQTDRRGNTTNFEYDIYNRATKQKDPAIGANPRGEINYTYNDPLNLYAVVDQTGARTEFGYDTRNETRFQKQIVRDVTVTPQVGAPGPQTATTVTGGTAKTTYFEYDDLGRQTKTTSPQLVTSTVAYNAASEITTMTDTANKTTTSTHDVLGSPVRVTDQLGRQSRIEYDQAGRAVSQAAWASDTASSYVTKTLAAYDSDGRVVAATSGRGYTTTLSYDPLGRLTKVTQPKDGFVNLTATYGYDTAGNLTRQRNPRGNAVNPVAEDDFAGNNGATWASKWTTAANSGGAVDVQGAITGLNGGAGHLKATTATGWARALGDATTTNTDAEVVSVVRTSASVGNGETKLWLRGSTAWATNNHNLTNGYAVSLDMAANQLRIKKVVSSTETTLVSSAMTFAANNSYRVRFQAYGSTLRARVWVDGTAEPVTWNVTIVDASLTNGRAAISMSSTATRDIYLDEYYVQPLVAPGGGSTPSRTLVNRATANNASAVVNGATSTAGELFVVVATYAGGGTPNLGISDSQSLTWNERATDTYTNGNKSMVSIFTATANGSSTNITVNAGSGSTYVVSMEVYRYSNHGGVGTAVHGAADVGTGGSATVNLTISPTTNANAETVAAIGLHEYASTPLTPAAGWTELYDTATSHSSGNGYGGSAGVTIRHETEVKTGAVSATSWSWTTGDEYSESYAAVEILPAAAEPTYPAPVADYDVITTYNPWGLQDTVVEPTTTAHPATADRTWTSVYDAGGLLTQDKQPGAITITNTYDALARLTGQTSGALSKTFGYDLASRPTTLSHPSGTQTLVYDDRSLLVGAAGPAGNMIATYNGDSQMLTRNDPAGNHSFGYDNRGRMTTAAEPLTGKTFNYTFNDAGQGTRVDYGTPGSSTPYRTYDYDTIGRLATDTSKTGTGTTKQTSTYTYDADNNVTQQVLSMPGAGNAAEGTYDYSYDRAGRLTRYNRASASTTTTDYRWDAAGNRTNVVTNATVQSWAYDQRNRITSGPEGTYTWDPRGTLDKIMNGATTVNDATFDNFGRMTAMTTSGSTINYTYDALDRLATRNVGSAQTFAYNGTSIDPSLAAGIKYSRSPSERLLGTQNGATTRLAGLNRHGDLGFWLDTAGTLTDTAIYDPFGKTITTTGSTGANVGFQGDYTDPTSTDVLMGARWYAPATATFRSRDTIRGELGAPISLNRYTYAAGNPISFMDPDGHYYQTTCDEAYNCSDYWVDDPVPPAAPEPIPYELYDPCAGGCYYDPCALGCDPPPAPAPEVDGCSIDPFACPGIYIDPVAAPAPAPTPVYDQCTYDMTACPGYYDLNPAPQPATVEAAQVDVAASAQQDSGIDFFATCDEYCLAAVVGGIDLKPDCGQVCQENAYQQTGGIFDAFMTPNAITPEQAAGAANAPFTGVNTVLEGLRDGTIDPVDQGGGGCGFLGHNCYGSALKNVAEVAAPIVAGITTFAACEAGLALASVEAGGTAAIAGASLCGAAAGVASQVVSNALNGDPLTQNAVRSGIIGGVLSGGLEGGGQLFSGGGSTLGSTTTSGIGRVTAPVESGNYVVSTPLGEYVGQSGNISVRLQQHVASGKFTQAEVDAAQRFAVPGTKLDREIAEQLLVDSKGGVDNLLNVVNPIGPARLDLMPNQPYVR